MLSCQDKAGILSVSCWNVLLRVVLLSPLSYDPCIPPNCMISIRESSCVCRVLFLPIYASATAPKWPHPIWLNSHLVQYQSASVGLISHLPSTATALLTVWKLFCKGNYWTLYLRVHELIWACLWNMTRKPWEQACILEIAVDWKSCPVGAFLLIQASGKEMAAGPLLPYPCFPPLPSSFFPTSLSPKVPLPSWEPQKIAVLNSKLFCAVKRHTSSWGSVCQEQVTVEILIRWQDEMPELQVSLWLTSKWNFIAESCALCHVLSLKNVHIFYVSVFAFSDLWESKMWVFAVDLDVEHI